MHLVKVMSSSAAVLVLALGVSVALAQEPNGGMTPGGPPAAGPNAGAAPNGGQQRGESAPLPHQGATGQARPDTGGSAATGGESGSPKKQKENPTAQEQGGGMPSSREQEGKSAGKPSEHEGKAATTEGKTGSSREGKAAAEGKTGSGSAGRAEAEGKGGTSTRLGSQQVSKVKSYFAEHRPSVQRIEKSQVSVSIGVVLPSTVVLYDLPPDIVVVEGTCPVKYFVWGDDIVLVDSCSRHVVEIIGGIA
jgi:hypothetical protein